LNICSDPGGKGAAENKTHKAPALLELIFQWEVTFKEAAKKDHRHCL
jgi:hypothetical protein